MHSLIVGMTESGKSTLAKKIAKNLVIKKQPVMVLDILGSKWDANYNTTNIHEFMDYVKRVKNTFIFIDESGEVGALYKEFFWLATKSRHYGHSVFFITQRSMQLKPVVRSQCRQLFLFCSAKKDCQILHDDFNKKEILKGNELRQGTFLQVRRFENSKKIKLF